MATLLSSHALSNIIQHFTFISSANFIAKTFKNEIILLFEFQAAAKVLAEAEKLTGKSAESSDVDEPQQTVFIDAPPPKVNVWLKKSDNSAQAV